ncbi:MAG: hypothetical protein Aurels2KO_08650 [Aureliella sp.]
MQRNWKLALGATSLVALVIGGCFYSMHRGGEAQVAIQAKVTVPQSDELVTSVPADASHFAKTYSLAMLLESDHAVDIQLEGIAKLISQTVAPGSWIQGGGTSFLWVEEADQSILVSQSREQHERIEELLASLESVVKSNGHGALDQLYEG